MGRSTTSASGYKSSADRCTALDVLHRPTNRPEFLRVTPWKTRLTLDTHCICMSFRKQLHPATKSRQEMQENPQERPFHLTFLFKNLSFPKFTCNIARCNVFYLVRFIYGFLASTELSWLFVNVSILIFNLVIEIFLRWSMIFYIQVKFFIAYKYQERIDAA